MPQKRHPTTNTPANKYGNDMARPQGFRNHEAAPIPNVHPDVGALAKELKYENSTPANKSAAVTAVAVILGGLILYLMFYQG